MTQHKDLELFAKNIRIQVLKALGELGFGHLGGAMSAADVLGVLYGGVMNVDPKNPQWEDRDYFVMSKGHAGPALYAPQHKLSHLIAFLDYNHQQLDGYTKDICDLGDMRQKFQDFGWYALEVDGHDVDAIYDAIALAKHQQEKPTMIVLQTQKGKGCFFAEGIKYNHHMRFSKEQCEEAIARLEKEGC